MKLIRYMLIPIVLVVLAGCAGQKGATQDDGSASAGGASDGASSSGAGDDGYQQGSSFDDSDSGGLPDNRIVYFGFDQSDVTPGSMELLADHARYLADNPNAEVRLEGHADERGSREYNIGLGERRAQAVRQVLLLRGVGSSEMNTVSYGQERPAATGSDDEAWALNRRVELVYSD